MTDKKHIEIEILGKSYRILCKPAEQDALRSAARYLDKKMMDIRRNSNVIGMDRMALMAALNLSHEVLIAQQERDQCQAQLYDVMTKKVAKKATESKASEGLLEFD